MRIFILSTLFMLSTLSACLAAEIHVNIPEFTLKLIEQGKIERTYQVALGTPYEQTPTGIFKVFDKEKNPTWYPGSGFNDRTPVPPGPDNPLGSRWMEFLPTFGIHGSNKGWDINYPVSGGCIRMLEPDVQQLYDVIPLGTPVIITYETMLFIEKEDGLYLRLLPDIYNRKTNDPKRIPQLFQPFAAKYTLLDATCPSWIAYHTVFEKKIAVQKGKHTPDQPECVIMP